ncbi:hypothetical protein GQ44DRAFT_725812 [Phaeosphaeriaceae sp. PMI808]|nr:hypothetical protein GQ44DRAFT_725812 [Phaeosphaeriaceae sp. PMI808]
MVLIKFSSALFVASIILAVAADDSPTTTIKNPITTPTVTKPASALVDIGCFETGTPLENHGAYGFQSPGNCQLVCLQENKNVMGLSDGENCWCGDKIPAKSWAVSNNTCDTPCAGDKTVKCGGASKLWIVLTGNTRNKVENFDPASSSSAKPTSAAQTSAASAATSSSPPSAAPVEDKPNTVGIAVGVVVGIVGLASIVGGVFFFLRRRRQKQAEDDYRRNAANVDNFVSGGKLHTSNSSMNDSRIDPSFMDRRQSNGSIADNEDYSRRILKVTNV